MDIEAEMRRLSCDQARDIAIVNTDDMFEVNIDVHAYSPEDLKVSIMDNVLIIKGKHEESYPGGSKYVSSEFERSYPLPKEAIVEKTSSSYSLDGKTLKVVVPTTKRQAKSGKQITSWQQQYQMRQEQQSMQQESKITEDITGIQVNRETSPSSNKLRC